jgi:2-dehydro-3-deoxyphosphogluconate aldolase/(4S)-4-hydroxy-2-oxoglutarate aldolase
MNPHSVRSRIEHVAIVPSVRATSAADARFAAETICDAGIPIIEIAMNIPGALKVVAQLVRDYPDLIVGAGTVLDTETALHSIGAGAQFLSTPGFDGTIVNVAQKASVLMVPGALTPTDITSASREGINLVRLFPCAPFGGPAYVRALKGVFPKMGFVAAGGINHATAVDFIHAGATAIGVGSALIPREAVEGRQTAWIMELARRMMMVITEARTEHARHADG